MKTKNDIKGLIEWLGATEADRVVLVISEEVAFVTLDDITRGVDSKAALVELSKYTTLLNQEVCGLSLSVSNDEPALIHYSVFA